MRFLNLCIITALFITGFSACKKNSDSFDTSPNFYFLNGGISGFDQGLILFGSADTVTYDLIISSTFLSPKDVTVTLGVDDSYRQSYNSGYGTAYQPMPSGTYSFQTTFTAGTTNVYDTIPVTLNKQSLATGSYMLPIIIETVSDYKIDTSARVMYLHIENNKLSGIYTSKCTKTLYNGDAADNNINTIDTFTIVKDLIPQQDSTSLLDYADLGPNGWKYILGFGADGGTFFAAPNSVIDSSVQTGSFKIITATFDPITKDIYIKSSYKNLSGDERIVEESLTLQ